MGLKNLRAICPNCGGKIHTQPKGVLGAMTWSASGPLVKTGTTCEHCGVALTGKVTMTNYAVLAAEPGTLKPKNPSPTSSSASAESREAYLARINSAQLGTPKKRRPPPGAAY